MATTYKLIDKTTLNSTAAYIEFTSIPSTYTDIKLVYSARTSRSSTGSYCYISFNGSTSSFSNRFIGGYGTGYGSWTGTSEAGVSTDANATASTFNNTDIYIPNYTSSNNKSFSVDSVSEDNSSTGFNYLFAGLWSNTASITSIRLTPESGGSFVSGSSFYLYGIKNS